MSIIAADTIKRGTSFIYNDQTRPCHEWEQPEDNKFRLQHEMIVDIYETCECGMTHDTLAKLTCLCIDANNKEDMKAFFDSNFSDAMNHVMNMENKYPLQSLIIVHSIEFNNDASISLLKEAFNRIQCILCQSASIEFGRYRDPGIYFDTYSMNEEAAKTLEFVLGEYNDGDMRLEKKPGWMYLHMIYM